MALWLVQKTCLASQTRARLVIQDLKTVFKHCIWLHKGQYVTELLLSLYFTESRILRICFC